MKSNRTEASLLDPVTRFARSKGFGRQREEVKFYEYRIDLYGYARRQDLTIAVELKLRNLRRATLQALVYQLCADQVYIAMPLENCSKAELDTLEQFGIGLIAVSQSNRCTEVLYPRPNTVVRDHYRKHYINVLMEKRR